MAKFQKGQSGNPGGRPKIVGKVREMAQEETPQAMRNLIEIMNDKSASPTARISAANAILDRACGKPLQGIALASADVTLSDLVLASMEIEKPLEAGEEFI